MTLNVTVNSRLKFLHRQNHFLTLPLRRILCNTLIQTLFYYSCTAWLSNLSKRLKLRLQVSQIKCMRCCFQFNKRPKIRVKEFLQLHWLNVHDRYLQFIAFDVFKFYYDQCTDYFDGFLCSVGDNNGRHSSNNKLKLPFRKTILEIQSLFYIALNTWNSLPNNLRSATSPNNFKHYIKEYFLKN